MTIRVGVLGAGGRMGAAVCRAALEDPDLELVGAVDPQHTGLDLGQVTGLGHALSIDADIDAFERIGTDVVVDFTRLDSARRNVAWCAAHGIHAVVGTTGFTDEDYDRVRASFTTSNCIIAPNFAVSAVLMMHFAELAAPWFESAEIIELHHDRKVDAPSGTAMLTAQRMADASDHWGEDPTTDEVLAGARGGKGPGGLSIHSVRLRGVVAHQEVLLGTTGQSMTIRCDSYDRTSFMPGVVLAVKEVARRPGLTVGLRPLLGL